MKNQLVMACLLLAVFALSFQIAEGSDGAVYRQILEEKAPSIVTVKMVLKTKINFMGQAQDNERTIEVPGVIVDGSGLIMIAADALSAGRELSRLGDIDLKVTPTKLEVIFEDDDEEYEAILGAKDTNLNLAFVQIKNLEGKEIAPVLFAGGAKMVVGSELIGVTRYSKGFDYAPYFGTIRITGEVTHPRPLWAIDGSFHGVGLPVFNEKGVTVGVLATQEGSEGAEDQSGGRMGMLFSLVDAAQGSNVFLLTAETVAATVIQAKKQAHEALKKEADEDD